MSKVSIYAYKTIPYEVSEENPSIELLPSSSGESKDWRLAHCTNVLSWKREGERWLPQEWLSWSYITGKHQYCWLEVAPGYLKQLRKFCREYNVTPESYPCWKMPGIMPVEYVPASKLKMFAQAKNSEIEQARIYESLDKLVAQNHALVKKSLKGTFLIRHHSGHWNPVSNNLVVLKQQVSHLFN